MGRSDMGKVSHSMRRQAHELSAYLSFIMQQLDLSACSS